MVINISKCSSRGGEVKVLPQGSELLRILPILLALVKHLIEIHLGMMSEVLLKMEVFNLVKGVNWRIALCHMHSRETVIEQCVMQGWLWGVSCDIVSCDIVSCDIVSCDIVSCDIVSCDIVSDLLLDTSYYPLDVVCPMIVRSASHYHYSTSQ